MHRARGDPVRAPRQASWRWRSTCVTHESWHLRGHPGRGADRVQLAADDGADRERWARRADRAPRSRAGSGRELSAHARPLPLRRSAPTAARWTCGPTTLAGRRRANSTVAVAVRRPTRQPQAPPGARAARPATRWAAPSAPGSCVVVTAHTVMPAARPEAMPAGASSNTTQLGRVDAEPLGGEQVGVGRRLAVLDLVGGDEHVGLRQARRRRAGRGPAAPCTRWRSRPRGSASTSPAPGIATTPSVSVDLGVREQRRLGVDCVGRHVLGDHGARGPAVVAGLDRRAVEPVAVAPARPAAHGRRRWSRPARRRGRR